MRLNYYLRIKHFKRITILAMLFGDMEESLRKSMHFAKNFW